MTYSDEILSAYLDGELSSGEAAKIDAALAHDAALQAQLATLLRANNAVHDAYGAIADEPLPDRVVRMLERGGDAKCGADRNVALFPSMGSAASRPAWALAIAASVVLALGLLFGLNISPPGGDDRAEAIQIAAKIAPGDPLFDALERVPSATDHVIDERAGVTARARLSFESIDGRLCRELVIASSRESAHAVACKTGTPWEVVFTAKTANIPLTDDQYRPATAATGAGVDAFLESFMAGDAFSAEEEKAIIDAGWRLSDPAP